MKLDLYTKSVLAVIAAALLVLAIRPVFGIKEAHASGRPIEVNIVEIAGKDIPYKFQGALPIVNGLDSIGNPVPLAVKTP